METLKTLSPALFGLIIFCFFLPFVNLSCSGQTIMSLTGFQLITGADVDPGNGLFDGMPEQDVQKDEKVNSQPMAILAFLTALAGLGLSFIKKKVTAITNAVLSALGFLFMILLKINMDGVVDLGGQYIITFDYQFGYWFTLLLFIAGAVLFWKIYKEPEYVVVPPGIPPADINKV